MANATTTINELLHWVRNSDVLTTTERSVTTASDTGTFDDDSDHLISVSNIKNIRSITVSGSLLTFGTDYDYDVDYSDSGTIKTKITFTSAQTGAYSISYDYGSDKIFNDYPRDDLKINSYPRIVVDILSEVNDAYGIGGETFIENTMFTIIVYAQSQDYIRDHIETIKQNLKEDAKNFYNFIFVKPTDRGPIIKSDGRNQTILHGNIDAMGMFNITNI